MDYGFKVLSFSDGVLILNIDGEIITFPNAVNERIIRAEYLPDSHSFIVETTFQVDVSALPEYIQLRVEEIEDQIKAAE